MDFIKKLFEEFKAIPETDSSVAYTIRTLDPSEYRMFDFGLDDSEASDAYFTQAEKQQLKQLLSDVISSEEYARDSYTNTARLAKVDGDKEGSTAFYKQAEKCQNKINSLAKLQYKLKYTLATRG